MGSSASVQAFDHDAQLLADNSVYSIERNDVKADDNATPIRVAPAAKDGLITRPMGVDNIWDQFQLGVKNFPSNPMFGTRSWIYDDEKAGKSGKPIGRGDYKWMNYQEVDVRARNVGKALQALGIPEHSNIGIFSINRAEWLIGALGLYSSGYRTVALYDTLGDSAIEYIVNHAELPIVMCSKDTLPKILKVLDQFKFLKFIVQFDYNEEYGNSHEIVNPDDVASAAAKDIKLMGFSELLAKGAESSHDIRVPKPDDLALIMYTSGTTGMPKGVMLTHGNVISSAGGVPGVEAVEGDSYVSFLPLAHIFETLVQAYLWAKGAKIAFFQGDPKKLPNDFNDIQPALIAGVPRVFQRMYQRVFEGLNDRNCLVRYMFGTAYNEQGEAVRRGTRIAKWDDKIFNAVKGRIGMAKTRYIITGGAPCPPYLIEFLRIVTGASVVQGYGLTETSAGATATSPSDVTIGHCGGPMRWAEVRLKTVDEMGYRVTDSPPRGEIQIRGSGVFKGYFKNEEATKDAFDGEWFCTGDIGRINPNGTFSIIDRKKNIFKLAHGEYIAVEKVEAVYAKCTILSQIWVYGNSFKAALVGVAVPAADVIFRIASEKGLWKAESKPGSPGFTQDFAKVFNDNKATFESLITDEFKKFEGELKGFEKVAKWHFETSVDGNLQGFTVENDCLTPTFKMRRPQLLAKYIDQVKQMYTDIGEPPKPEEKWLNK